MDYLKFKELKHYGIKGQKWGVRRYQNEDGSLTPEGSSATRKNIQRLMDQNKSVDVYELSKHGQSKDHWVDNK